MRYITIVNTLLYSQTGVYDVRGFWNDGVESIERQLCRMGYDARIWTVIGC